MVVSVRGEIAGHFSSSSSSKVTPPFMHMIIAQKVLFCALINSGFEHFLCSNHPN